MNKLVIILFAVVCVFFIGYLLISTKKSDETNRSVQFNGVIESVSYDEKGIPFVKLNGKEYYLDAGYNFEHKLEKGDRLCKENYSNVYKLIKPTGEIILFKN